MATIKSYTDLEQSKKLAEILPLESADMCYIQDLLAGCKYGEYKPYIGNLIPAYGQDKLDAGVLRHCLVFYLITLCKITQTEQYLWFLKKKNRLCQMIMTTLLMLVWL